MSGVKSHIRDAFTLFTVGRRARELVQFAKSHFLVTLAPDPTWRVLVIAPHPDDESIGCGGTVARIVASGGVVDVVFITDGGEGILGDDELGGELRDQLKKVRIEEAERACALLGVREMFRLKARDGGVSERMDLAVPLAERIERGRYTHVFAPWPYDLHRDHSATFRILRKAARRTDQRFTALLYEVWTPLQPNAYIDITEHLGTKVAAIGQHRSQVQQTDFVTAATGLARYRGACMGGSGSAEAFLWMPSAALQAFGRRGFGF